MTKFLFLDIETTGFNPEYDFITQIAGVLTDIDGNMLKYDNMYLSLPEGELMPSKAMRLTGITDELLAEKGISIEEAESRLDDLIDNNTFVVAHYAPFDLYFIESFLDVVPDFIDTRTMSYYLRPGKKASLKDLTQAYGIVNDRAHNALYDAGATKEVFFAMLKDAGMAPMEAVMMFEGLVGEKEDRPCDYYPVMTRAKLTFGDEAVPLDYRNRNEA